MERIVHLIFVAAVACAAQAAWSQKPLETPARAGAVENATFDVAALGRALERHEAAEAQMAPKRESLLQTLGLAGTGPFPSRGGPLDD